VDFNPHTYFNLLQVLRKIILNMTMNIQKIGEGVKYIDIHSHLDMAEEVGELSSVLQRMREAGVATISVGTDLKSSKDAVRIAESNPDVWACIGAHPEDDKTFVFEEKDFIELVKSPKVVAIGECGLDYFSPKSKVESQKEIQDEKERQKKEFVKQIEFAIKYDKPLMLHIRSSPGSTDAHDDAYEILKKYSLPARVGKARGNLHFFTGSSELANKFIDLGYTISFPGVITFAKETQEAVKNIPLEKMHAETDSPYATPVPYRGKKNEPAYVVEVVKKIAELRGEDKEVVRLQLLNNAIKTFNFVFD